MAKSRSNDPHVRPSVRQPASQSAKEFLEPADSFDLGDDVSSAEAAAGEWLGRKAAAKSRKKKSLKAAGCPRRRNRLSGPKPRKRKRRKSVCRNCRNQAHLRQLAQVE